MMAWSVICYAQQKLIRQMVPEPVSETQKVNPEPDKAYVHVKSQIPNLRFDSNRKIDKVVQTSSGDWDLWLPGGTHILKISADGYQMLELPPFNYGKKKSFELKLKVMSIYSITTNPVGALVKIDDQDTLTSPGRIELELGAHKVEISKPNYESLVFNINLTEESFIDEKKLSKVTGAFLLRTDPSEADVAIDGHIIGKTPIDTSMAIGEHRILISKMSCEDMAYRIILDEHGYTDKKILVRRVGSYHLTTNPPEAKIKIDGADAGKSPVSLELGLGKHAVEIDLAYHDELSYDIDLTDNGLRENKDLVHYYPSEAGIGFGGAVAFEKNMFTDSAGNVPSVKGGIFVSLFYRFHFSSHLSAGVRMSGYVLTLSEQKFILDGVQKKENLSFGPFNLGIEGRWTFFRGKVEPYWFLTAGAVMGDMTPESNSSTIISSVSGFSLGTGFGVTMSITKQYAMSVELCGSFGSGTWDKMGNPYSSDLNYNPSFLAANVAFSYRWGGD